MVTKTIIIDNEKCDFCGTCVGVCPTNAIELMESTILIDEEHCSLCLACVDICPLGVVEEVK